MYSLLDIKDVGSYESKELECHYLADRVRLINMILRNYELVRIIIDGKISVGRRGDIADIIWLYCEPKHHLRLFGGIYPSKEEVIEINEKRFGKGYGPYSKEK